MGKELKTIGITVEKLIPDHGETKFNWTDLYVRKCLASQHSDVKAPCLNMRIPECGGCRLVKSDIEIIKERLAALGMEKIAEGRSVEDYAYTLSASSDDFRAEIKWDGYNPIQVSGIVRNWREVKSDGMETPEQ